jgi:hypothetical protein
VLANAVEKGYHFLTAPLLVQFPSLTMAILNHIDLGNNINSILNISRKRKYPKDSKL